MPRSSRTAGNRTPKLNRPKACPTVADRAMSTTTTQPLTRSRSPWTGDSDPIMKNRVEWR